MAIKINWQDLLKRYINWQEIVRVYKNGWEVRPNTVPPTPPAFDDYLCFTAKPSQYYAYGFQIYKSGSPYTVELEISSDKTTWTDYDWGWINVPNNSSLYIRNKSETPTQFSKNSGSYYYFTSYWWVSWPCDISWNVSSLLCKYGTNTVSDYCFYGLFSDLFGTLNVNVTLPATTLAPYCYANMFLWRWFHSATIAPTLPATTLAEWCYQNMFMNWASLITPPELPATTLAPYCYYQMFSGCTSLSSLPELKATTLPTECYEFMFEDCSNIRLSTIQDATYVNEYRIPSSWTGTTWQYSHALDYMFTGTWWTFTGTPQINTTYYTSNTVI